MATWLLLGIGAAVSGLAAWRGPSPAAWQRLLERRLMLGIIAAATATSAMAMVDWQRDPVPVIGDEASYRLQASLFASGRWSDTAPEFPEAFRQIYVLDTPRLASKYPPGHALMLTPGMWLGFPWLMPMLCLTLSGVLVFSIGRRLATGTVGLVAWLAWLSCSAGLAWRGTWYSETTSALLMLLGWWLVLEPDDRTGRLAMLGLITGALGITRPLTAVAFALPVGVVLLRQALARRRWRMLGIPIVAGLLPLGVLPLWSARTLGRMDVTPLGQYTRDYMPWDVPGFGPVATPPRRVGPPDQRVVAGYFSRQRAEHTVASLPTAIPARLMAFARGAWSGWRRFLLPVGVLGLFLLPAWLSGTLLSQFLCYAFYFQFPDWTLYYVELVPVMALALALGLQRMLVLLAARLAVPAAGPRWVAWLSVILIGLSGSEVWDAPELAEERTAPIREFREATDTLPPGSLVFVSYTRGHLAHRALVANLAPRQEQSVLIGREQGPARDRIIARRLGRTPYQYSEGDRRLRRLSLTEADTANGS